MEANNDRNANPAAEDPVGNDGNDEDNNHGDRAEEADDDDDNEDEDRGDNNNDMDLEDDDEENDNDSTLDGGVAIGAEEDISKVNSKAKKHSSECDLVSNTIHSANALCRPQYKFYANIFIEQFFGGRKTKILRLHLFLSIFCNTTHSFCIFTAKNQLM